MFLATIAPGRTPSSSIAVSLCTPISVAKRFSCGHLLCDGAVLWRIRQALAPRGASGDSTRRRSPHEASAPHCVDRGTHQDGLCDTRRIIAATTGTTSETFDQDGGLGMERPTRRDIAIAGVAGIVPLSVAIVACWFKLPDGIVAASAASAASGLVVAAVVGSYRRIKETREGDLILLRRQISIGRSQIEAFVSLNQVISPTLPLAPSGDWAASADFLRHLVERILTIRPRVVVEFGSGVSTLVTAYALERIGAGRLLSIDHDADYAAVTRARLVAHGVSHRASVVVAPLEPVDVDGQSWQWYGLGHALPLEEPIDVLIVDGPPGAGHRLARYPAIPILRDRLSPNVEILLDDGARPDEREIARRWGQLLNHLSVTWLDTEKGAFWFHRRG